MFRCLLGISISHFFNVYNTYIPILLAQAPIFGGWCPPFLTAQKYRPGTAGSGGCQRLEIQASKDEKARGACWAGLELCDEVRQTLNCVKLKVSCSLEVVTHGMDSERLNHSKERSFRFQGYYLLMITAKLLGRQARHVQSSDRP